MAYDKKMFILTRKVQEQLVSLGVLALYFFGSRSYGLSNPRSDFDFGVFIRDPRAVARSSVELYQSIYDILSNLIQPETLEADVIDIVFLDSPRVPLELKFHIISLGHVVLDVDPQQRITREEQLMIQHADFAPLKVEMRQALLARL